MDLDFFGCFWKMELDEMDLDSLGLFLKEDGSRFLGSF